MIATHNNDDMQSNAVWDRGKEKQDVEYIKRLESSLETYLEAKPAVGDENRLISPNVNPNILNAYLLNFDNVSSNDEVDLESMAGQKTNAITLANKNNNNQRNKNNYNEPNVQFRDVSSVETASLSNLHNIQYIEYVQLKLEQLLKTYKPPSSQLETKILELKKELEKYVEMINQKKEIELRRFSENMSNHSNIVHMRNAFMKKEMNHTVDYDNVSFGQTDAVSYYSSDSIADYERRASRNFDGFFMRNCYDKCSFNSNFDTNSIEYYSMLITEERNDNLVNDAPVPPPRYNEQISLIYRNPDDQVIKQWQQYQLNAVTISKPKKNKKVKIKAVKEKKRTYDIWSFTLDYHKTRMLQMKLEKERKIRLICRTFFYFFGLVCFVLVVIIVRSIFSTRQK